MFRYQQKHDKGWYSSIMSVLQNLENNQEAPSRQVRKKSTTPIGKTAQTFAENHETKSGAGYL